MVVRVRRSYVDEIYEGGEGSIEKFTVKNLLNEWIESHF